MQAAKGGACWCLMTWTFENRRECGDRSMGFRHCSVDFVLFADILKQTISLRSFLYKIARHKPKRIHFNQLG